MYCGDLDWAGDHLGRLVRRAVLSDVADWILGLLATVGVGCVHILLDLGVILVL